MKRCAAAGMAFRVWAGVPASVAALLLAVAATAAAAAPPADESSKLLDCMRGNVPPSVRVQDVQLSATDRGGGARTLKGRLFAINDKGRIRASLRIAQPPDLSGAAYLLRETAAEKSDEMFMFLPSVNRVRRINGASAESSLLGTDFSYNDIKQLENAFGGATPALEKPSTIDGHAVKVLLMKPTPSQESRYTAIRSWVDQKTCVALKVAFYEGDKVRKELLAPASALQQSGNFWYAAEVTMRDLKENTSTTLRVLGVASGTELPSRYFDPNSFYLGN